MGKAKSFEQPQLHPEIEQRGSEEVDYGTVKELLENGQNRFLSELSALRLKIITRDMEQLKKDGRYNPYQHPSVQVGIPGMCGYSASAMTEIFREILGNSASSRTVYGYYDRAGLRTYHYWTEITVQGQRFVVCATYGQLDKKYSRHILFDSVEKLGEYGLKEYQSGEGGTEMDENIMQEMRDNDNNLQIGVNLDPELEDGYDRLKVSLTAITGEKAE